MNDQPEDQEPAPDNQEAMWALEQNARIDRVPRMVTQTTTLTDEERLIAINNFRKFIEATDGMNRSTLARMAGVGASSLAELFAGKYKGDVGRLIGRIEAAINEHYRRQDAPTCDHFVKTGIAKRIFTVLKTAASLQGIGAFYCVSGVGKTMALEAALQVDFPSGILVKSDPGCASPVDFCREVLRQVMRPRGVPEAIRTRGAAFNAIRDRLIHSKRLILIDEADVLPLETLAIVRQIHDATGCPMVLCGRPNLAKKLDRTTRNEEIGGSLRGRLCVEHDLMSGITGGRGGRGDRWLFSVAEVAEILSKFKVTFQSRAVDWLTMLANLSAFDGSRECGALRYATKVAQLAVVLARQQGVRLSISLELVKAANSITRDPDYAAEIAQRVDGELRQRRTG